MTVEPVYFPSATAFRKWLAKNHRSATELWVGYHKVAAGRPSMTWAESVDEALCVGWIDGLRRSVDSERYTIRFTPRKRTSQWSAINVKRVGELVADGRMLPPGLAAFDARGENSSGYSYEQRQAAKLDRASQRTFRANKPAWEWFQSQPPSYRGTAIFWVMSAKKDETRARRLAELIDDSAKGLRVGPLRPRR